MTDFHRTVRYGCTTGGATSDGGAWARKGSWLQWGTIAELFFILSSSGMFILLAIIAPRGFSLGTSNSVVIAVYQLAITLILSILAFSLGGVLKSRGMLRLPIALLPFSIVAAGSTNTE